MMKMNCFSRIVEWIVFVIFGGSHYRRFATHRDHDLNLRKTWIQALLEEVVMGIAKRIYIHHPRHAKIRLRCQMKTEQWFRIISKINNTSMFQCNSKYIPIRLLTLPVTISNKEKLSHFFVVSQKILWRP